MKLFILLHIIYQIVASTIRHPPHFKFFAKRVLLKIIIVHWILKFRAVVCPFSILIFSLSVLFFSIICFCYNLWKNFVACSHPSVAGKRVTSLQAAGKKRQPENRRCWPELRRKRARFPRYANLYGRGQ